MEKINVRRAIVSSLVCNTLVWYDYALFGKLVAIISSLFFPYTDKYVSLIATFGVFALGFIVRPIGASVFGHIGDRYGRKVALMISIISMSVPVAFMAMMPTYESVGILAPIMLILSRLVQGFALGGESGNATFLIEHSSDGKNKGLFGSFEVLSAVLGSILSVILVLFCEYWFGDDFAVWGWRMPFVFGFFLGILSIYVRQLTAESPAFHASKKNGDLSKSPLYELIRDYKRPLIISILLDSLENAGFYMFMVFFAVFLQEITHITQGLGYYIEIINMVIVGVLTLTFASLSDIIGRKKVIGTACIAFIIISVPVFYLLRYDRFMMIMFAYLLFAVPFSAALGPSSAAICELFPTKVRYSGFSLARNISAAIFGGLAPIACTWLIKVTNIEISPSFYMIFCAILGLIAVLQIKSRDVYS